MPKYRVFISYAREDRELAKKVAKALKKNGMVPMWDTKFEPGCEFREEIRNYIAHCHVFLPILTKRASPWTHQEIGYAMALNLPILPVCLGVAPGQMIERFNGLTLNKRDKDKVKEQLTRRLAEEMISRRVQEYCDSRHALFECAESAEQSAEMLAEYAEAVLKLEKHGRVRQKGGLSSFCLPGQSVPEEVWRAHFDGAPPEEELCARLRRQRLALEEHAREKGCDLILNPHPALEKRGPESQLARLTTLIAFLKNMRGTKSRVAIVNQPDTEGLTIVGDWFLAEGHGQPDWRGHHRTFFTRHAASIRSRQSAFDGDLKDLLDRPGSEGGSRKAALRVLMNMVSRLKS